MPQYGVSETADVTQYIDAIISCQRTWHNDKLDNLVELQMYSNVLKTAGANESELHAAIHPDAYGQSRDYDLAIDLGLGHVTTDTNSLRYDMPDEEFYTLMKSLNFEQMHNTPFENIKCSSSSFPVRRCWYKKKLRPESSARNGRTILQMHNK